ncbi:MAG: type II toxin-antitoxin system RelE/ParE family toxin [Nitrospinae bacterium]|nr:type II toxin-antitoxin system RelE/ParE family toxin [Nitrospinota bacterium]MBF0633467.1 type II toxin-antitoxin system RelE/ParE family toxin [Nitrospinota bacterium]
MRVKWTRTALSNLDSEASYIALDDPAAASRMVSRIVNGVAALRAHPAMGRPGRVPGTRELVVGGTPYLIPYRVKNGALEILRVFHHSRKCPESL